MSKTKVFVLYTGGTIGMAPKDPENPASPLVPKPLEDLKLYMPALERFGEKIEFGEVSPFDPPIDSSNLRPGHWREMAKILYDAYDHYDGFIVLHGTDTMAYTASGLSFAFQNLSKPIVVTGSQLPISDDRTDAITNFTHAIYLAGYKAFSLPRIPEVVICFADKILRGNRTTKVSSTQWAAFDSPNFQPLGRIGEHIKINTDLLLQAPPENVHCIINTDFVEDIMNISLFPGFNAHHLRKLTDDEDIQGVIINTFGSGNAQTDEDLMDAIAEATKKGKIILNISQCPEGMVEMGLYAASSGLLERGVVSGLDMTTEAAMAKLMWTLGTKIGDERLTQLQINQRGEQSENLFDLRYGPVKKNQATYINHKGKMPDRRLERNRLSKAVVRISNAGVLGVQKGQTVTLNIFMNKPMAKHDTADNDNRCVGSLSFVWEDKPQSLVEDVTDRSRSVIGDGDIVLSIASPNKDIRFYHDGLYLALFSKA